jgi:Domain of unknown function (DUF4160)
MPKLAMVAGVRIVIWPNDHEPGHIHCFYSGQECRLEILTGAVIDGDLERAKLNAVSSWLDANRAHVAYAWNEIMSGRGFKGPIG